MPTTPYQNNLALNDRVFDTESKRQGKVARMPRETSRSVSVLFDGTTNPRYLDIMQLRLMPDGRTPEDVPPCDGVPADVAEPRTEIRVVGNGDLLTAARQERTRNADEMAACDKRFRFLKDQNERLDRAIAVLTAPAE